MNNFLNPVLFHEAIQVTEKKERYVLLREKTGCTDKREYVSGFKSSVGCEGMMLFSFMAEF